MPPPTGARLPLPPSPAAGGVPFDIPPLPAITPPREPPLVQFLKISLRRAFRVRIDPREVLEDERAALGRAGITDPVMVGYLAWRRSVLFGFAAFLVPLIILRAVEVFDKSNLPAYFSEGAGTVQGLNIVALIVDAGFCGLCFWQWTKWTDYRQQRRLLTFGWLAFFFVPFVLYLYPLRTTMANGDGKDGVGLGMVFTVQTLLVLAPRALALLPGVMRSSLVTKYLFPNSPAPGWVLVAVAPLFGLFTLVVLVVPYQLSGSGFFVLALGGFLTCAYFQIKAGLELNRPIDREQFGKILQKTRTPYYVGLAVGALFVLIGLAELIDQLDFKPLTVVNLVATAAIHIWIVMFFATDQLVDAIEPGGPSSGPPPPGPPGT